MRFVSLFAGVGGFDLGAEAEGWECVAQVEWDVQASGVLSSRWPDVPKWGDVRSFDGRSVVADVVVGGFPCQDVSIAGRRAGIGEGTRSGLYGEIVRVVKEMRDATGNVFPRWVVLENVRGLLTVDQGDAFGTVLDDLADLGALVIEYGMVDSQYVGVPQRRQRVFVAACFDPATARDCPNPLFPLRESMRGDSRKKLKEGTTVASLTATGAGVSGPDLQDAIAGHIIPTIPVTGTTDGQQEPFVKVHRAHNTSDDETWRPNGPTPTLNTVDNVSETYATVTIVETTHNVIGTLSPGAHPGGFNGQDAYSGQLVIHQTVQEAHLQADPTDLVIGFNWANGGGYGNANDGLGITEQGTGPLTTSQVPAVAGGPATVPHIRRLTPLECERLQGWPDNHTLISNGKEQKDTPRYKQIGNGISAPAAAFICRCINRAESHAPSTENIT